MDLSEYLKKLARLMQAQAKLTKEFADSAANAGK